MSNLLYLVHRLPYPPNKGDKVRSFHLLRHLAARHKVFLGTFIDDPQDEAYVDTLAGYCAGMHIVRLSPRQAKLRSLSGLLSNEALTLPYYRNAGLSRWIRKTVEEQSIDVAIIFSSAMAQYLHGIADLRALVDFVDVDSAKWTQYAANHRWPMSWLYRREGRRLLAFEREVAKAAEHSFLVTENEVNLFCSLAPECTGRVAAMSNGVDAEFFSPDHPLVSPYKDDELPIVFTGAMDYWPNIDAVSWFVSEIFPLLLQKRPHLKFYIVGRSPAPTVSALANERVVVTGTVPDVRPYLRYANVVVAPLRLARGIQNKVLEAMAMATPVVASAECAGPVDAVVGRDFLSAVSVEDYCRCIENILDSPEAAQAMGSAARQRILERYSWDAHLSLIDSFLEKPRIGSEVKP